MDNFFVPIKSVFENKSINVLDIDSGLEFLADDIFNLVNVPVGSANSLGYCDLPENLQRIRTVLIDGLLCQKQTLNWLALKHIFCKFNYEKQKEFIRWTRKTLSPRLTLEKLDDSDTKILDGINILSWFFTNKNKSIKSLVSVHQSNLTKILCASPSIILKADRSREFDIENIPSSNHPVYETYLNLLKKEINIPDYQILRTSDLGARLLRQRYLESALIILEVNNVRYFNLYNTFVCSRDNLLLAQELDIAVLFGLKKRTIPYLMLQVIEGGLFLQSLLACTLDNRIEKSLCLQIKEAYIYWLSQILANIEF